MIFLPASPPRLRLEAAERDMRRLLNKTDREVAHWQADKILTDVLRALGYHDLCDVYERIGKWYG